VSNADKLAAGAAMMKTENKERSPAAHSVEQQELIDNVEAARQAVGLAESELDRVIDAIKVAPRVEKKVVSEAVAAALTTLRAAREKLDAASRLLEAATNA
jgi:hypothetical protein